MWGPVQCVCVPQLEPGLPSTRGGNLSIDKGCAYACPIKTTQAGVLDALRAAEQKPKCPLTDLFTDVYKEMPEHLARQSSELQAHIAKFPGHY